MRAPMVLPLSVISYTVYPSHCCLCGAYAAFATASHGKTAADRATNNTNDKIANNDFFIDYTPEFVPFQVQNLAKSAYVH